MSEDNWWPLIAFGSFSFCLWRMFAANLRHDYDSEMVWQTAVIVCFVWCVGAVVVGLKS